MLYKITKNIVSFGIGFNIVFHQWWLTFSISSVEKRCSFSPRIGENCVVKSRSSTGLSLMGKDRSLSDNANFGCLNWLS